MLFPNLGQNSRINQTKDLSKYITIVGNNANKENVHHISATLNKEIMNY